MRAVLTVIAMSSALHGSVHARQAAALQDDDPRARVLNELLQPALRSDLDGLQDVIRQRNHAPAVLQRMRRVAELYGGKGYRVHRYVPSGTDVLAEMKRPGADGVRIVLFLFDGERVREVLFPTPRATGP